MIRKADGKDARFIYEVLAETLTPWSEKSVEESIKKDLVFVADGAGVIIARAVLDECEILNFAVKKEKRRQGTGTELLDFLLKEAKGAGTLSVYLDVRKTNSAAILLYKKAGFSVCGERKNYYTNPQEDAVLMKKEV